MPFDTNASGATQGLYSGRRYLAIHTDTLYEIDTETGAVSSFTSAGGTPFPQPPRQGSLAPATAGLYEHVGTSRYLVYVRDAQSIVRLNLQSRAVTTIFETRLAGIPYPGLGGGASLAVGAPPLGSPTWLMPLAGTTAWGTFTAGVLRCDASFSNTVDNFALTSLSTANCRATELAPQAGDARGPLLTGLNKAFLTGREATVSLSYYAPGVAAPELLGASSEHLVSDVATGELYGFFAGPAPLTLTLRARTTVDRLVPLSPRTLLPTGPAVLLSRPLTLRTSYETARDLVLASGWHRAVVLADGNAWNVELPSGRVADLGPRSLPPRALELATLATTGLAETTAAGGTSLLLVTDPGTLTRVTFGGALTAVLSRPDFFGNSSSVAVDYSTHQLLGWSSLSGALAPTAHSFACPATFTR